MQFIIPRWFNIFSLGPTRINISSIAIICDNCENISDCEVEQPWKVRHEKLG